MAQRRTPDSPALPAGEGAGAQRHDPRQKGRPTYDQSEAQKDPRQRGEGLGEMHRPDTRHGDGRDPADRRATDPREQDKDPSGAVQPKNAPRR